MLHATHTSLDSVILDATSSHHNTSCHPSVTAHHITLLAPDRRHSRQSFTFFAQGWMGTVCHDAVVGHITATLNSLATDDGPYAGSPPRPCTKCNNIWWCICYDPNRPPYVEPHYIIERREQRRLSRVGVGRVPRSSRSRSSQRSRPLSSTSSAPLHPGPAPVPPGPRVQRSWESFGPRVQRSWEAVEALLSPKVLHLERTKPLFKRLLKDPDGRIKVQLLASSKYYVQHAKSVIASLPPAHGFKIGITNDPDNRFHLAHYAYTRERSQARDRVRYSAGGMILIHAHHSREVIAMMEHALIDHWQKHAPGRCVNRKSDFDDHIKDTGSGDSEDHDSAGPHFLYVSHGPRC